MNFSNFFIFFTRLRFCPRLSYFVILISFAGFYSCQKIEPANTHDHLSASETDKVRRDGPPNVVLVLGDDIGYEIPTINGGQSYSTPNIDLLAQQGAR